MSKTYEWSLIPYPYFRAFTLFNAFILSSLAIGIITGVSIELRNMFNVHKEHEFYSDGFKEDKMPDSAKTKELYNPGTHIKCVKTGLFDHVKFIPQAIRATVVSTVLSFIVYIIMYFIFGFGGSMTSPRRRWTLFSSIPGNKSGQIFV